MARLSDPITILKGIGPAKAKQFANLNIFTLQDLICHFPRGYEDRTRLLTVDKLENAKQNLSILHPLPRVNEISVAVDDDPRACYFKQVLCGKYMRMALILKLLGV